MWNVSKSACSRLDRYDAKLFDRYRWKIKWGAWERTDANCSSTAKWEYIFRCISYGENLGRIIDGSECTQRTNKSYPFNNFSLNYVRFQQSWCITCYQRKIKSVINNFDKVYTTKNSLQSGLSFRWRTR